MFVGPEQKGCSTQHPSAPSCSDQAEAKLPLHTVFPSTTKFLTVHLPILFYFFCLFVSTGKLCSVLSGILISLISVRDFPPTSLDLGFGFVATMGKECDVF